MLRSTEKPCLPSKPVFVKRLTPLLYRAYLEDTHSAKEISETRKRGIGFWDRNGYKTKAIPHPCRAFRLPSSRLRREAGTRLSEFDCQLYFTERTLTGHGSLKCRLRSARIGVPSFGHSHRKVGLFPNLSPDFFKPRPGIAPVDNAPQKA